VHRPGSNPQPIERRYWSSAPHADLKMVTGCWLGNNQRAAWCGHFFDHVKSEPEPPDLRPSSNVDFPVAWITGPGTDPSLSTLHMAVGIQFSKALFLNFSNPFFRLYSTWRE
jgi:hypothetical protein